MSTTLYASENKSELKLRVTLYRLYVEFWSEDEAIVFTEDIERVGDPSELESLISEVFAASREIEEKEWIGEWEIRTEVFTPPAYDETSF